MTSRVLLVDIGNSHVHTGLAHRGRITQLADIKTSSFLAQPGAVQTRLLSANPSAVSFCSVVPKASPILRKCFPALEIHEVTAKTVRGVGLNYPHPATIGADRLANAVAVRSRFGAPAVVVDFGTAVTFDVVDAHGDYAGGIIAPGLEAMTDYLHEKTALLPRIRIREVNGVIGKSTQQAMLIGAVHGYRGLIRDLLGRLKKTLRARRLPVVATGGYARLMAARLPEIVAVEPLLTLQGLLLEWRARGSSSARSSR